MNSDLRELRIAELQTLFKMRKENNDLIYDIDIMEFINNTIIIDNIDLNSYVKRVKT